MRRLVGMIVLASVVVSLLWLQTKRGPRYTIDECAAPKLVPALRRMEQCSPALYEFVASQPTRFGCTPANAPFIQGFSVLFPLSPAQPHLSAEANQYLLMLALVHSSRLAWQSGLTTQWTIQQRASDAYGFADALFRDCPTSDPTGVEAIRKEAKQWAQIPELPR